MKIRLDPADVVFSRYIRLRDGKCMRCGKQGTGPDGIVGLQCSHYFGRGRENTRFDDRNCTSLCFGCHRIWGSDDREGYRNFMIQWLGEEEFFNLTVRAQLYAKKDRKLSLIYAKSLLNSLNK